MEKSGNPHLAALSLSMLNNGVSSYDASENESNDSMNSLNNDSIGADLESQSPKSASSFTTNNSAQSPPSTIVMQPNSTSSRLYTINGRSITLTGTSSSVPTTTARNTLVKNGTQSNTIILQGAQGLTKSSPQVIHVAANGTSGVVYNNLVTGNSSNNGTSQSITVSSQSNGVVSGQVSLPRTATLLTSTTGASPSFVINKVSTNVLAGNSGYRAVKVQNAVGNQSVLNTTKSPTIQIVQSASNSGTFSANPAKKLKILHGATVLVPNTNSKADDAN